jgi:hypothetical protein
LTWSGNLTISWNTIHILIHRHRHAATAEPADQVFYSFSKISISKERKLQKYNFIYLAFIKLKDIAWVCRILSRNQWHFRVIQDQLFFQGPYEPWWMQA